MKKLRSCSNLLRVSILVIAATIVAVLSPSLCFAGSLATTPDAFFGTINGISGHDSGYWRGHTVVNGFLGLSVDVDFAVFAPGSGFGDFLLAEYAAADPTDGTKYVYAFQATTLSDDSSGGGLNQLKPGYDTGENLLVVSQGEVAGTGTGTSAMSLQASSAEYDWASGVGAPGSSTVLYYTSPFAPQKDRVSISSTNGDSGQSGEEDIASPSDFVPEPSSVMIWLSGIAIVGFRRMRQ